MTAPAPRVSYDGRHLVADHGTHTPRRIVLHDTESHDAKGIGDLEGIAVYWHGVSWGPGAHVGVDAEGYSARYVDDTRIGYHVENHNTGSLGIEQVGFAWFSLAGWRARAAQLEETACWCAHWCSKHGIPPVVSAEHGISTHAQQSAAYHGSHTDPGRGYPLDRVLGRVKVLLATGKTNPPKPRPRRPDPFWLWLRWRLGEGEFRQFEPHDKRYRPPELPQQVPKAWWGRAERFVAARAKSSLHPSTTG